ncbi:MAG: hypothetical protein VW270_04620 [Candidatus Poseidoniales archaeon]
MPANTAISVTGLDFDSIRSNLQTFIQGKAEFADMNFDDSAIGTLLDLLAYNTYYNAMYTNMALNETFLDTAQLYESVASRAKEIGYLPRSAYGATANVKITFNSAVATELNPNLVIPKNTSFTSSVNGVSYEFVTPQSYSIAGNTTNGFADFIQIVEGVPLQQDFVYTTANTEFILRNDNVDTRSISVQVTSGGVAQTYTRASDLKEVKATTRSFFLEADRDKRFKISFGDGVIGQKPEINDIVTVDYRVCDGTRPNGANTFTSSATISGETDYTITVAERAAGGAYEEGIDAIRFNAPRAYETQNRAVTTEDYKRIILREFTNIAAVNVWGGEQNDPPIYGKVYACVKPKIGNLISTTEKERIKQTLNRYNVQSIDAEFVDPNFLYIRPYVRVRYTPTDTTRLASEIASLIATKISTYETDNLNTFTGSFRLSRFLDTIDNAEVSIVGSQASVTVERRIQPQTTAKQTYTIQFNRQIYHPHVGHKYALSSSAFTYKGRANCYFDDDGDGLIRIYYFANNQRIYVEDNIGTINYRTGKVAIENFLPDSYGDFISIIIEVESSNISPARNQILLLSNSIIDVVDDTNGQRASRLEATTLGSTTTLNQTGVQTITSY